MDKRKSLSPVKKVCGRLGVGRTKVYELFASGKLTPLKLDGRTLVDDDEVDQLIESLRSAIDAGTVRLLPGAARTKQAS